MPNRMLRDWTNSEKVNSISVHAERFFTRLIMKVDDYGCFYGNEKILKANLYPLLLDAVREADLSRWMAECQKAGLVVIYETEGKKYIQVLDFRQRLDRAKAKFPLPNGSITVVNDFPPEVEEKYEVETEVEEKGSIAQNFYSPKNQKKEKKITPGAEIFYSIEHCLTVACGDERWVKDSRASPELLQQFNLHLSGQGIYEKNPAEYKSHFYHWVKKNHGTHKQSNAGKSGTSDARIEAVGNWGKT